VNADDLPHNKGLVVVISGPSGVGKTTITHRVEAHFDAVFSVSVTTRPKTRDDVEGRDYHFVTPERFAELREGGELLEWAQVFDHFYGTPRRPIVEQAAAGKLVILEIDVQGAIQVRRNLPEVFAIFVEPPSEEELLRRLRGRAREDEATIQRRFSKARQEIARAHESGVYDRFIVNDDRDAAVAAAIDLIAAERDRRGRDAARPSASSGP